MNITIFVGDIADAPAEALCTSTNPRLSLMMGTGAAIRARGGDVILRECERVQRLAPGSVHVTTAGRLSAKRIIHCVASDAAHNSSEAIVRSCVIEALAAANGCDSIAMPLFATGHARMKPRRVLEVMAATLAEANPSMRVFIVVRDPDRVPEAKMAIERVMPDASVSIETEAASDDETPGFWQDDLWR